MAVSFFGIAIFLFLFLQYKYSAAAVEGVELSTFQFDGVNFNQWQREIVQALLSKNKDGFITGRCPMPATTDRKHKQWVRVDLMVSRWIVNSLDRSLRDNFQFVSSSKNLWIELLERYGQLNILELYELKKLLVTLKQDNLSLVEYYSKIKNAWENLDAMDPMPRCSCGVMASCTCNMLHKLLDRETQSKLIQFLMGLNSGYEQVQTTLLAMEPLPPLTKVLGMLQKIEKQKLINDVSNDNLVSAAYSNRKQSAVRFDLGDTSKSQGNAMGYKSCTHCGKGGHETADCYQLQVCLFCDIKGHTTDNCYKLKAFKAKRAKGKTGNGKSAGSQKNDKTAAHNAECVTSTQDSEYQNCSDLTSNAAPVQASGSNVILNNQHSHPDFVQDIVNSVMTQVLQALQDKPGPSSVSPIVNYAGPFQ